MVKRLIFVGLLITVLAIGVNAQEEEAEIKVDQMNFCINVVDRQPVNPDTTFADTVEFVYCFTKIVGAEDTTEVTHVWYYENQEKARVTLPVKSPSWRTWSSKRILETWYGKWRVDVLSEDGEVLKSKTFTIKPSTE
jgi:hypothetical protein